MKFGGFNDLFPNITIPMSTITLLGAAEVLGFIGYLSGMFEMNEDGDRVLRVGYWDVERASYTAAMWICWGLIIFMVMRTRDDSNLKLGVCTLVSMPVVVFVILFFDLIQLSPK